MEDGYYGRANDAFMVMFVAFSFVSDNAFKWRRRAAAVVFEKGSAQSADPLVSANMGSMGGVLRQSLMLGGFIGSPFQFGLFRGSTLFAPVFDNVLGNRETRERHCLSSTHMVESLS